MLLRFIHAADVHLDTPFSGMTALPERWRKQLVQATFTAFSKLCQLAIKEEVDFVLLAGDTFDSSEHSLLAQLRFQKELERLGEAGIYVYLIRGNHDALSGTQLPLELPDNVITFSSTAVEKKVFRKAGKALATIYGYSYPSAKFQQNVVPQFQREEDLFSIGLLHTNCAQDSTHGNYAPCTLQDLKQTALDYWALGHIHKRQILHQAPWVVYPGNLQGRHKKETGEKGCYLVEVDQQREVSLRFCPLQEVLWLESQVDIAEANDVQEVLALIESSVWQAKEQYPQQSILLAIQLVGQTELWESLSDVQAQKDLLHYLQEETEATGDRIWMYTLEFTGTAPWSKEELLESEGVYKDLAMLMEQSKTDEEYRVALFQEVWADMSHHTQLRRRLANYGREEQERLLHQAENLLFSLLLKDGEK